MKSHAILTFLSFITAGLLYAGEGDIAIVGQKAPSFSGEATNGTRVTLDDHSGKVILLDFFATWCGPCMIEMPHLEKDVWQANRSANFTVIAVGREHSVEELIKWNETAHLTFTIVGDPKREIYSKYATQSIPRCYVIGKDGFIKYASAGYSEEEFAKLKAFIAAELKR